MNEGSGEGLFFGLLLSLALVIGLGGLALGIIRKKKSATIIGGFFLAIPVVFVVIVLVVDATADRPSTTTVTAPASASPPVPSSTSLLAAPELPLRAPVDVLTRIQPPYIGQPAPFGGEIAFLDLPRIVGVFTSDLPADVGLLLVGPVSTKLTELTRLQTPAFGGSQHIWPCWQLSVTSGVPGGGVPPSLYWSGDDPGYGGLIADGLTGMTLGGTPRELIPQSRMIRQPFVTGDFVAIPVTSSVHEASHSSDLTARLGEHLLLTARADMTPVEVDPRAPHLPAQDLPGVSPYVSWTGYVHDWWGAQTGVPQVFDLRTGKPVTFQVPDLASGQQATSVVLAGRWLAWTVSTASGEWGPRGLVYLTDLETGETDRVFPSGRAAGSVPSVSQSASALVANPAISRDWLLWLEGNGDLVGLHLPDRAPMRVAAVLRGKETAELQLSGDLVVLHVRFPNELPVLSSMSGPDPSALRVIRLR